MSTKTNFIRVSSYKLTLLESQVTSLQNTVAQINYKSLNTRLDDLEDVVNELSGNVDYIMQQGI